MPRKPRVPKYCHHKPSGQAYVRLNGDTHYLGAYDSQASRDEYHRLVGEWLARGRAPAPQTAPPTGPTAAVQGGGLTVAELILRYWTFAEGYYPPDGDTTSELRCIRAALRPVRKVYGATPAAKFGPLALKAVRQAMVELKWCRSYINHQVVRVRRMFRWAASEELVPAAVYEALRSVAGLAKGRSGVRESAPRAAAFWEQVAAVLPHCIRPVKAMLELQWLTGMRSVEVRKVRMLDLDRTDPQCWRYRPGSDQGPEGGHRNAWRGQRRVVVLGPRAVALLTPWLRPDEPAAFLFSPRLAVEERNAKRRAGRRPPLTPSQRARKRKANPKRAAGACYRSSSYAQAVARACRKAGVKFQPYSLRHGRKMEIERSAGVEAARAVLGQKSIDATQHYGEQDLRRAREVITRLG